MSVRLNSITSLLLTFFLHKGDCLWLVLGDHLHNAHLMQIHSQQSCNLALSWAIRWVQFKTLYRIIAQTVLQTWFIWLNPQINMYSEDYIKKPNALKAITQYHGQKKLYTFNIVMILPSIPSMELSLKKKWWPVKDKRFYLCPHLAKVSVLLPLW